MSRTKLAMSDDYNVYDYEWAFSTEPVENPIIKRDSRIADKRIKHCESCNRCHESSKGNMMRRGNNVIIFYDDFPTFGKSKEKCVLCLGIPVAKVMQESVICYEVIRKPKSKAEGWIEYKPNRFRKIGL